MNELFNKEAIPVMLGTKCSRCREGISMGVFEGEIRGTLIYFCQKCHLESELHPIGGKKVG